MPVKPLNLDDRTFADLLAEVQSLIPRLAPGWTDHNVSDPGIMVLELFAWLTEAHVTPLARLAARCDVWAIQIVDAAERALPEMGLVRFHDMASGQRVWLDTGEAAVRGAVRSAFADHLAAQASRLTRAGVRHQQVDGAADDLAELLIHG